MLESITVSGSEVVAEISYDGNTITVTTHTGNKYQFPNEDSATWEMFKAAESKGRFFNQLRRSAR